MKTWKFRQDVHLWWVFAPKGQHVQRLSGKMFALEKKGGKIVSCARGHLKPIKGGKGCSHIMIEHWWCYFCRMAHTRGGNTWPVVPPRVYTTPLGVKVRKVHGGYIFQPPSLKVSSYLTLDKYNSKAGLPRSWLYEGVQKFMDHLIDQVEDRLLGLDSTGTHCVECSKFVWNSGEIFWVKWNSCLPLCFVAPVEDQTGCWIVI